MKLESDLSEGVINHNRKYAPRGSHVEILAATLPEVLISGPAGTGKSRACLEKLNYCAQSFDGSRYLILRQARASLNDTGLVTFERDVLGYDHEMIANGPKRPWRKSYDYPNGSQIVVGGLDKPGKVLSSEYDIVFIQQAEEATLQAWEILTTRLRNNKLPFHQILADCNPQHPVHWLRKRAADGSLDYIESVHKDNPVLWDGEHWTEEGHRYIATLDRLTGSRKLRLRYGKWVSPEGAIYNIFDEEKHIVKSMTIPRTWPRAVGIDPFGAQIAALWVAFDPTNGIINVYREYVQPFGLTTAGHAENILRESRGEAVFAWVCGGPSERAWRVEWQAAGIPVVEPPIKEVWVGIDRVYQLLREFRLVIHDSCPGLLSEIGDYRRKVGRDGIATEKIEGKERYHLLDALRYVIAWLTEPGYVSEVGQLPRARIR